MLEERASFPDISLVVLDLVRLEECHEFFLKRELPVVGFLTGNVTPRCFHLGFANRECAISVLPMKTTQLGESIMNPARRVRLDRTPNVGDCLVLPQSSQEMDMVGDAIGEQTKATLTANRATQVFPQPGPQLALKPRFPVLGGKHKVIEKADIGMGHEIPLFFPSPAPGFGAGVES